MFFVRGSYDEDIRDMFLNRNLISDSKRGKGDALPDVSGVRTIKRRSLAKKQAVCTDTFVGGNDAGMAVRHTRHIIV